MEVKTLFVIALLAVPAFVFSSTEVGAISDGKIWYNNHTPIDISGDAQLSSVASSENWSGNGTYDDPYIIENYSINSTSGNYAIGFQNTESNVVIRNCLLHTTSKYGIYIRECNNISIENCRIVSEDPGPFSQVKGVSIYGSRYIRLFNSTFDDLYIGSYVLNSNNIWIVDNTFRNIINGSVSVTSRSRYQSLPYSSGIHIWNNAMNRTGIRINHDKGVEIDLDIPGNNTMKGSEVKYIHDSDRTGNPLESDLGQLLLFNVTGLVFKNSTLRDTLLMSSCYSIDVTNITVKNTNTGMELYNCYYIDICGCELSQQSGCGVEIQNSGNIALEANEISGSGDSGLFLFNASSCNIYDNAVENCERYGVFSNWPSSENIYRNNIVRNNNLSAIAMDWGCSLNSIVNNSFYYNRGTNDTYQIGLSQALDDGNDNLWNGNFWADWTSPDSNGDGIVDNSYSIDGSAGSKDMTPLVYDPNRNVSKTPLLYSGNVNPGSGDTNTLFEFRVYYADPDGDDPMVNLSIDGIQYMMEINSSTTDGYLMFYKTTLSAGGHNFHFVANYGTYQEVRYPEATELTVNVSELDGPTLMNHYVENLSDHIYDFRVNYYHPLKTSPQYIRLETAEGSYNMSFGSDFDSENRMSANITLELPRGYHGYMFSCMDINGKGDSLTDSGGYFYLLSGEMPTLTRCSVEPTHGNRTTDFTFSALYTDPENEYPDDVYLSMEQDLGNVTKILYTEMELKSGDDPTEGLLYTYTVEEEVVPGYHTFSFQAEVDGMEVTTEESHFYVTGTPPLMNGGVEETENGYRFHVVYDDGTPDRVRLHIEGGIYALNLSSSENLYEIEIYLEPGDYVYYFTSTRSVLSYREPVFPQFNYTLEVEDPPNRAPSLKNGTVDPETGNESTTFTFSVLFSDPDGDSGTVTLNIDGNVMEKNCTSGTICTFETGLLTGSHRFHFSCEDSYGSTARYPESGYLNVTVKGEVNDGDPWNRTGIKPHAEGTVTVDGMMIKLDGSDSYDIDGRITYYVWEYEGKTYPGMVQEIKAARIGLKRARLTVSDNEGLSDSAEFYFYLSGSKEDGEQPPVHYSSVSVNGTVSTTKGDPDGLSVIINENGEVDLILNVTDPEEMFFLDIPLSLLPADPDDIVIYLDGKRMTFVDPESIGEDRKESAYTMVRDGENIQLIFNIRESGTRNVNIRRDRKEDDRDTLVYLMIPVAALIVILIALFVLMRIGKGNGSDPFKDFVISSGRLGNGRKKKKDAWEEFLEE